VRCEVGAQQIASLAAAHLAQPGAIELELEGRGLGAAAGLGQMNLDQMGGSPGLVPGCAQLHEQLIARERLELQGLQALHVAAQAALSHRTLLVDACRTLRQHVGVFVAGQALDIDAFAHALPRLCEESLLELGQPPLGGAHEIGRSHAAHLRQAVFGGHAAVHHPDPVGSPVALLDAIEELAQRR